VADGAVPCADCGHIKDGHIDRIDARPGQCDSWVRPAPTDLLPDAEIEALAAKLSPEQRLALVEGRWNVATYGFDALRIVRRLYGYVCELTPVGKALRTYLLHRENG